MSSDASAPAYEGWAIVEIMGHRRIAGFMREVMVAGAPFVRIDQPGADGDAPTSHFYNAGKSIFGFVPVTEAAAVTAARTMRSAPVNEWDLPCPQLSGGPPSADSDDNDDGIEGASW